MILSESVVVPCCVCCLWIAGVSSSSLFFIKILVKFCQLEFHIYL